LGKHKSTHANTKKPLVVINGEEIPCINLIYADSMYKRLEEEHRGNPDYKIALIYNSLIYQANYDAKEYKP